MANGRSRSRNAERCLCRSLASAARKEIACFEQLSRIDQCCVSVMDCRYWNELYNMKHHLRRWGSPGRSGSAYALDQAGWKLGAR